VINFEPIRTMPLPAPSVTVYRRNTLFDAQTERGRSVQAERAVRGAGLQIVVRPFGLLAYVLYYNPDAFRPEPRGVGLVSHALRPGRRFYRSAPAAGLPSRR
jgi:hypothetical protein